MCLPQGQGQKDHKTLVCHASHLSQGSRGQENSGFAGNHQLYTYAVARNRKRQESSGTCSPESCLCELYTRQDDGSQEFRTYSIHAVHDGRADREQDHRPG